MLKTAFGLYQNDPTVGNYEQKNLPHETIELKFKTKESASETQINSGAAPAKNSKLQQKLDKWKQEQQRGAEVNIKIGGQRYLPLARIPVVEYPSTKGMV